MEYSVHIYYIQILPTNVIYNIVYGIKGENIRNKTALKYIFVVADSIIYFLGV